MAKAELAKRSRSASNSDGPQLRLRIESGFSPRAGDAGGNADGSVTIGGRCAAMPALASSRLHTFYSPFWLSPS